MTHQPPPDTVEAAMAEHLDRKPPPSQGPMQAWHWSRLDGTIRQVRVRPSGYRDYWIEDYPSGWSTLSASELHASLEDAARSARAHFERKLSETQDALRGILLRLEPVEPAPEARP